MQSIKRPPPPSPADSLPLNRAEQHRPSAYMSNRSQIDSDKLDKTSDYSETMYKTSRPKTKLDNESLSLPKANETFENQEIVSNLEIPGERVIIDEARVIPDNSEAGSNLFI